MASGGSVVSIGLGSSTVKVAEFQVTNGGLTILRFGVFDLGLDPNKEENRSAALAVTVRQAIKDLGIRAKRAVVSMSGQTVFLKNVKLPPVDSQQASQMIGYEAQQNVPFPIEEVVWDYQMMKGRTKGETEAVIVAMKSDLLESEHRSVETAGLTTAWVDVAPLALYNCFLYNYESTEGGTLVIDLGARTTTLLFIESGRLFTRSIPIAGNQISQNICNEFQEPFTAAETMKKGKGFVNLGGAYADPDDKDSARISKLVRSTMTRLHNEINRSITFYKTQHGGSNPKRVLLTGGTALLPYVDVFLSEKLGQQVEFLNPFRNVSVAPGLDRARLTQDSYVLAETVGAALRFTGTCPVEIDLSPKPVRKQREAGSRQPAYLMALVAWILLCALPTLSLDRQLSQVSTESETLRNELNQVAGLEPKMKALEAQKDAVDLRLAALKKIARQRKAWVEILSELNSKIPEGVWITQLTPSCNGAPLDTEVELPAPGSHQSAAGKAKAKVKATVPEINQFDIKGLVEASFDPIKVNEFVSGLAQTGKFDLNEKNLSQAITSVDSSSLSATQIALNYQITLSLKPAIDVTP